VTKTAAKPALILRRKLALKVGVHNGINYSEDEVRKLYLRYQQLESKPFEQLSMEEVHAFDLFKGGDEDHKDSTGTWVGSVKDVYWDDTSKGFGFDKWNIVDEDFARKIEFQKSRGKASFGVSPRLNVLRKGTDATDILPKNIGIVLNPAGGEDLMLSRDSDNADYELREDIIQELTLSEQESIQRGGELNMDEKQIAEALGKVGEAIEGINTRLDKVENAKREAELKAKEDEMKLKCEALEAEKVKLETELAKKKEEEEKMQAGKGKGKDKEDEEKMSDEEKAALAKKKEEEEKMQAGPGKDKKYKYYGAASARDSLLKKFAVTPDLRLMDEQSINRVAEDIVNAAKIFDATFTLEKAQKGIEELQAILLNLPSNAQEEKALMEHVEETLSSVSQQIVGKLDDKLNSGSSQGRRKGLVLGDEEGRADETLSGKGNSGNQNQPVTKQDVLNDISSSLCKGLGIK